MSTVIFKYIVRLFSVRYALLAGLITLLNISVCKCNLAFRKGRKVQARLRSAIFVTFLTMLVPSAFADCWVTYVGLNNSPAMSSATEALDWATQVYESEVSQNICTYGPWWDQHTEPVAGFTLYSDVYGWPVAGPNGTTVFIVAARDIIVNAAHGENCGSYHAAADDGTYISGFPQCQQSKLQITSPTDQSDFTLTQNNLTTTNNITFTATSPNDQQISWSLLLEYATSGGYGALETTRTFTNLPSNSYDEQYQKIGGRLTVTATQGSSTDTVTVFITGSAIPDDEITNQLVALYGGATPNLMTGIAQRESSYMQFATLDLYGYNGLWPNESFDGGSHIGLMQMPTTEQTAWDWTANTEQGVNLFMQKLAAAGRLATRIINSHPGLRALTPVEMEHMAVVLYGPKANGNLNAQYYIPTCVGGHIVQGACRGGAWDWQPNDAGNPAGVAYADYVFHHLH